MKKALITGITGQDGSYLAEFFVTEGTKYMVLSEEVVLLILDVSIILLIIKKYEGQFFFSSRRFNRCKQSKSNPRNT